MKPSLRTFLAAAVLGAICAPALGAVLHMNADELVARADLVAMAEVISVDQAVDSTRAQLRLLQVFKGPEGPGNMVLVQSNGGKVYIDENEPRFTSNEVNLLFLQKAAEGYVCVNQGDGQKIVRGKNIYPYHDNASYSVPLKDYLKVMEGLLKARQAENPSA